MKYYYIETDTDEIYIKDYPTAKEIQDNLLYKDQKIYPIQEKFSTPGIPASCASSLLHPLTSRLKRYRRASNGKCAERRAKESGFRQQAVSVQHIDYRITPAALIIAFRQIYPVEYLPFAERIRNHAGLVDSQLFQLL